MIDITNPRVEDEPMSPGCMKCEQVTGNSTCFPGPCIFFRERSTPGSKAHSIATLDRIRRGARDSVHAPPTTTGGSHG